MRRCQPTLRISTARSIQMSEQSTIEDRIIARNGSGYTAGFSQPATVLVRAW